MLKLSCHEKDFSTHVTSKSYPTKETFKVGEQEQFKSIKMAGC